MAAKQVWIQECLVIGKKQFPLKMLSIEHCFPRDEIDVDGVSLAETPDMWKRVHLRRVTSGRQDWRVELWDSLGWKCVPSHELKL